MREVDLQSLVIKTVREAGGAAHKLSNRFLIGVSDLLVKLPGQDAMLIEAKFESFSAKTKVGFQFKLEPTLLQLKFLREYEDAGMRCGVMSFVEHGRGIRNVRAAVFRLDRFDEVGYFVPTIAHHRLLGSSEAARAEVILDILTEDW